MIKYFKRNLSVTLRASAVINDKWLFPIENKEKLFKPLSDNDVYRFRGIRPAPGLFTTSLTYDPLFRRFKQVFMRRGNRFCSNSIVEGAFVEIKHRQLKKYRLASNEERHKIECNPQVILEKAVSNCKPLMRLVDTPKGGIIYQVPIAIGEYEQVFRGIKFIVEAARVKPRNVYFVDTLARELIDASNNTGIAVRAKEALYRKCEANKAYAHYR